MTTTRQPLLQVHIAVFLFGISGLFAKLLPLDVSQIVLGRTLIGAASILLYLSWCGSIKGVFLAHRWWINLVMGAVLALHWMTFFYSIQVSSVAVGLLSFASFPVFVTLMEPLLFRERLRALDVITAVVVVLGLYLVVTPEGDNNSPVFQGAVWGCISAFLFAVLSLSNRKLIQNTDAISLSFLQNTGAALFTLPLAMFFGGGLEAMTSEVPMLLLLGLICTTLPIILFLNSLKTLRAQLVSLITSLEPVYGIIFALILMGETPSDSAVLGGIIMIGAIAVGSIMRERADAV
ncbi:DMT family transporter [Endozoicomonas arenosclerae]|uniref:DMT family transporter n=1 Tax=Endozoicomonas arenosclerae TaxID=1633495 RepID=UPI0007840BEA|nr:DMT family transporter [Endozoicomonas arenosclerae]